MHYQIRRPVLLVFLAIFGLCKEAGAQSAKPLYRQAHASVAARVQDLLNRMTLQEKVAQLRQLQTGQIFSGQQLDDDKLRQVVGSVSYGFAEGLTLTGKSSMRAMYRLQQYMVDSTRLGIPVLPISESLHGSVGDGSTIFPQSVALGSTFNPDLAYRMTAVISRELKAQGIRQTMSPGMDVVRDLRWGRVEESFGEDPYLVGRMSIAEVRGYLDHGISAMLKPFGPDGAPTGGLNLASVACGEREARSIYLKPYQMVLDSTAVSALMTSYSSWNGVPNSASRFLLTDILRNEWGFKGYVYSDWGAVEMLRTFHHTATDDSDAALQALRAGVDVEAASHCYTTLPALVQKGVLDIHLIDTAVARVLRTKFQLGLFDQPFGDTTHYAQQVHRPEAVQLSRTIADESIVLLKNQQALLPLHADRLKSLAIIGPNADQVQFGDYTWSRSNQDGVTPLAGIKALLKDQSVQLHYAKGCELTTLDSSGFAGAVRAAKSSDLSILFMGSASASLARDYSHATSGEGFDLARLQLTGMQEQLIRRIYAVGKPVILVLVTGKPFALPWEKAHLPAIVVQWYGGERAGDAIAAMLFGKTNPSGKLPFSFPRSVGHLPVYYNHLPTDKGFYHHPGSPGKPGRDYVFSSPDALWSFGHGRSYTTFKFMGATVADTLLTAEDTVQVQVRLANTGHRAGKEVVQLYVRDEVSSVVTPVQQLKAFQKVAVQPGDTATVLLKVPVQELALYNLQMEPVVEPGTFALQIGSASDSIACTKTITVVPPAAGTVEKRPKAARAAKQADATVPKGGAVSGSPPSKERLEKGALPGPAEGQQESLPPKGKLRVVSGEVRDVQATPVGGVQVRAVGSGNRARTDDRGRYRIEAYSNDTLIFSSSGYQEKKQPVSGSATLNVRLQYRQR